MYGTFSKITTFHFGQKEWLKNNYKYRCSIVEKKDFSFRFKNFADIFFDSFSSAQKTPPKSISNKMTLFPSNLYPQVFLDENERVWGGWRCWDSNIYSGHNPLKKQELLSDHKDKIRLPKNQYHRYIWISMIHYSSTWDITILTLPISCIQPISPLNIALFKLNNPNLHHFISTQPSQWSYHRFIHSF